MDYQAEQEMEVEALQSILMDDFAGSERIAVQAGHHMCTLTSLVLC